MTQHTPIKLILKNIKNIYIYLHCLYHQICFSETIKLTRFTHPSGICCWRDWVTSGLWHSHESFMKSFAHRDNFLKPPTCSSCLLGHYKTNKSWLFSTHSRGKKQDQRLCYLATIHSISLHWAPCFDPLPRGPQAGSHYPASSGSCGAFLPWSLEQTQLVKMAQIYDSLYHLISYA